MVKTLASGLLGRVAGLGIFGGGFWLLFTGFNDSSIALGVLGGVMIPAGMWLMAAARRAQAEMERRVRGENQEG